MGVIVPDAEATKEWAKEQGMDDLSFPELCRQPLLKCVPRAAIEARRAA